MSSVSSSLVVLHPSEGKRYKINIKGDVTRLTIEKIKTILKQNTNISIPLSELILKYNAIPLLEDQVTCGAVGIHSGGVIEVGDLAELNTQKKKNSNKNNNNEIYSPQKQQLEKDTLRQQQDYLRQADRTPENKNNNNNNETIFDKSIKKYDTDLHAVQGPKKQLQDQKEEAERQLNYILEKEKEAQVEKDKLIALRQLEEQKRKERKQEIEDRRELLKKEEEAIKELQLLQLENEKKKNLLLLQKQIYQSEKERVFLEQDSYDHIHMQRELQLREREMHAEQAKLFHAREQRELAEDRQLLLRQKLHYYNQQGMTPPAALLQEIEKEFNPNHNHNHNNNNSPYGNTQYSASSGISPPIRPPNQNNNNNNNNTFTREPLSLYRTSPSPMNNNHNNNNNNNGSSRVMVPSSQTQNNNNIQNNNNNHHHPVVVLEDGGYYDAYENAVENLARLGEALHINNNNNNELCFDENNTCVVSVDNEFTLLFTFDAVTERLFIYSTLLTNISDDESNKELKLKLYEYLLECSLLGREMAGGGIGASMQPNFGPDGNQNKNNNFILLSSSIYLPTSQPWTLKATVPQFIKCLRYWRKAVAEFIENFPNNNNNNQNVSLPSTMTSNGTNHHQNNNNNHNMYDTMNSSGQFSRIPYQTTTTNTNNNNNNTNVMPSLGLEVTDRVALNNSNHNNNNSDLYVYEDGVLVVSVTGPAALAGVLPHDCIKQINQTKLKVNQENKNTVSLFQETVQRLTPGDKVTLLVERQSLPLTLQCTVGGVYQL